MFFLSANIHNHFNEPPEGTALRRVVGTAAIGGFLHAPIIHWWFGLLEKTFPGAHPARVLTKVFLDQTIGLAMTQTTVLFCRNSLDGLPPDAALHKMIQVLPSAFTTAWKILPWIYLVNFSVVPLHQRPLVGAVCVLGWTTYLLYMNSMHEDEMITSSNSEDDTIE